MAWYNRFIRKHQNPSTFLKMLGYPLIELAEHLEKQFDSKMN